MLSRCVLHRLACAPTARRAARSPVRARVSGTLPSPSGSFSKHRACLHLVPCFHEPRSQCRQAPAPSRTFFRCPSLNPTSCTTEAGQSHCVSGKQFPRSPEEPRGALPSQRPSLCRCTPRTPRGPRVRAPPAEAPKCHGTSRHAGLAFALQVAVTEWQDGDRRGTVMTSEPSLPESDNKWLQTSSSRHTPLAVRVTGHGLLSPRVGADQGLLRCFRHHCLSGHRPHCPCRFHGCSADSKSSAAPTHPVSAGRLSRLRLPTPSTRGPALRASFIRSEALPA